jgi:two-component system, NarL family, nitrate/nitrite response regulator NarL
MMKTQREIRVLIIDDHELVSAGLRMLIESEPEMKVVGKATNSADALALAAKEKPSLILLDLDLGPESGIDLLPELRKAAASARVLIVTALKDSDMHRRAARLGAAGLVLKEQAADVLLKAIRKVSLGEIWLDRSMMSSLLNEMTSSEKKVNPEEAKIATLTNREREVIALIAEGLKNKQIGERLFISETTVTHHLSAIFSKLGVSDRLELVIYGFANGLAQMPKQAE